jgi:CRISPR/Cas system-associated exonuclease Cas4 (RecB family)
MAADYISSGYIERAERGEPMETSAFLSLCQEAKSAHRKFSKSATDIGKEVHAFAERALVEQRVTMPQDPQARLGAEAFLGWLHSTEIKPISIERMLFSKAHFYAGTCDFYGHINGELCVMDLKTSSGLYREMPIQLAAYAVALEEETGEHIDHSWIVRLDKKTGKCEPHYIPLRQSLKNAWLAVLEAYRATKLADELVEEVKAHSKQGTRATWTSIQSSLVAELG